MKYAALILLALVACTSPTNITEHIGLDAPPLPAAMGDVKLAKWIRLPHAIVSRGAMGAFTDPDEATCTEPDSIYLFYDDMSIVQYKPLDGQYANLAMRGHITVELHNRDNPDALWDYVAVAPPYVDPTVVTPDPDPVPPAGVAYYVTKTHTIAETYAYEPGGQTWASWCTAVALNLELTNRDRPADDQWHQVLGAAP
jgi:hypothetical protein